MVWKSIRKGDEVTVQSTKTFGRKWKGLTFESENERHIVCKDGDDKIITFPKGHHYVEKESW